MTRSFLLRIFPCILTMLLASHAFAQGSSRTFVASTGSDGNPCSIFAPCRTIPVAVNAVAAGGDVIILDSGGYGDSILITKSVSIVAQPGVVARVRVPSGGFGFRISTASVNVTLDGVGIQGSDGIGVDFVSGAAVLLKNMDINVSGANSTGVSHSANTGVLTVQGVTFRNSNRCMFATASPGNASYTTVGDSQMHFCNYGIYAGSSSYVSVQRSTASGRGRSTVFCQANFASEGGTLTLEGVTSTACGRGVFGVGSSHGIGIANSVISGNDVAGSATSVAARTYGNNVIFGNITNTLTGFTNIAGQ